MSCADVCLDHDYDDDNDFYDETLVRKARKPHECCECREAIPAGTGYQRVTGKSDGRIWMRVTCLVCREIRMAFVCGSWRFGELWASIEAGMFPVWTERGPIDCLAKLETLAARDKCRDRYRDWQADGSGGR